MYTRFHFTAHPDVSKHLDICAPFTASEISNSPGAGLGKNSENKSLMDNKCFTEAIVTIIFIQTKISVQFNIRHNISVSQHCFTNQ